MLRARLLDVPQLLLHGMPPSSPLVGKGLALFAYVALHEDAVPRDKLLELLWYESPERQARENLRSLLYSMRQILGDHLTVTRHTVAFNRLLPYWLDVEVIAGLERVPLYQNPQIFAQILDLHCGEFLGGLRLVNAPLFEGWARDEHRRLTDLVTAGWQSLARFYRQAGRLDEGLAAIERLLKLAPWDEEAHRHKMQMLAANGQVGAALAHYNRCKELLEREVSAAPSAETNALYQQLRSQLNAPAVLGGWESSLNSGSQAPKKIGGGAEPDARFGPQGATGEQRGVNQGAKNYQIGGMPFSRWFVGREKELQTLHQWLVTEECRVVSIHGMGGQGKTALAARFVERLAAQNGVTPPAFEGIIWHSLLTAPPLHKILQDWIYQLSDHQVYTLPPTLDRQIDLLMGYLTHKRYLFVLDNAESLSTAIAKAPEQYADYAQIWQILLARPHRSSVLITSREKLWRLGNPPESPGIYRKLQLEGLSPQDGAALLKKHGVEGSFSDLERLHLLYSGNPLALDRAVQAIDEFFDGEITLFLAEETPFLGDIGAALAQQFEHLSPLEQEILTWLALEQTPVTSADIEQNLLAAPGKSVILSALQSLVNCGLAQQNGMRFSLQNMVGEYVLRRLQQAIYDELTHGARGWPPMAEPSALLESQAGEDWGGGDGTKERADSPEIINRAGATFLSLQRAFDAMPGQKAPPQVTQMVLNRYALNKACESAKRGEPARATRDGAGRPLRERLLVTPLAEQLGQYWGGRAGIEKLTRYLLSALREEHLRGAPLTNGYATGNLLTLLQQHNPEIQEIGFRAAESPLGAVPGLKVSPGESLDRRIPETI